MPFDLKKTINLPSTAFPMKANLPAERAENARTLGADGHL